MLHQVITTEKVPVTYRVAGMGSRFLAWLADAAFIVFLVILGVMPAGVLESRREGLGSAVLALWVFFLQWGYFLLFEWLWVGQTPGKRLMGLRVIQDRGAGLSFGHAAARNLLRAVDALPAFYALGFAVAACDRLHRRLGDLAAGTLVVHMESKARAVQALPDLPPGGDIGRPARLAALDRRRRQALLDLCLRREQLPPRDRARLFRDAAEHTRALLGLPADALVSDEKFVLGIAAALGGRGRTVGPTA